MSSPFDWHSLSADEQLTQFLRSTLPPVRKDAHSMMGPAPTRQYSYSPCSPYMAPAETTPIIVIDDDDDDESATATNNAQVNNNNNNFDANWLSLPADNDAEDKSDNDNDGDDASADTSFHSEDADNAYNHPTFYSSYDDNQDAASGNNEESAPVQIAPSSPEHTFSPTSPSMSSFSSSSPLGVEEFSTVVTAATGEFIPESADFTLIPTFPVENRDAFYRSWKIIWEVRANYPGEHAPNRNSSDTLRWKVAHVLRRLPNNKYYVAWKPTKMSVDDYAYKMRHLFPEKPVLEVDNHETDGSVHPDDTVRVHWKPTIVDGRRLPAATLATFRRRQYRLNHH